MNCSHKIALLLVLLGGLAHGALENVQVTPSAALATRVLEKSFATGANSVQVSSGGTIEIVSGGTLELETGSILTVPGVSGVPAFLLINADGTTTSRSAAQILSDMGAASLGANTFSGTQGWTSGTFSGMIDGPTAGLTNKAYYTVVHSNTGLGHNAGQLALYYQGDVVFSVSGDTVRVSGVAAAPIIEGFADAWPTFTLTGPTGVEGVLEMRQGASKPQTFRIYRTFTNTSNYERLALQTGADYFELSAETAGTGADNFDIRLTPAGTGVLRVGGLSDGWVKAGSGNGTLTSSALPWEWTVATSDETSDLTVGDGKITFRMPIGVTLTSVRASVNTAPSDQPIIVDVTEGGSTIFSTLLTIDAGEETSTTAATPAVLSDTSLADDAEISINIDQVGGTTKGAGLKVTLKGTRTP